MGALRQLPQGTFIGRLNILLTLLYCTVLNHCLFNSLFPLLLDGWLTLVHFNFSTLFLNWSTTLRCLLLLSGLLFYFLYWLFLWLLWRLSWFSIISRWVLDFRLRRHLSFVLWLLFSWLFGEGISDGLQWFFWLHLALLLESVMSNKKFDELYRIFLMLVVHFWLRLVFMLLFGIIIWARRIALEWWSDLRVLIGRCWVGCGCTLCATACSHPSQLFL